MVSVSGNGECILILIICLFRNDRLKLLQRDQYRSDMERLRRIQAMFREKNRREIEEEDQRIAAYLKERDAKLQESMNVDHEKRKKDEELRERLRSQLDEIEVCRACMLLLLLLQ